jgi:phage/plasmid-associated DNA primase
MDTPDKVQGSCLYQPILPFSPVAKVNIPFPYHTFQGSSPDPATDDENENEPDISSFTPPPPQQLRSPAPLILQRTMDIDDFLQAHQIATVPVRVITIRDIEGKPKKRFVSLKKALGLPFSYGQNVFQDANHLRIVSLSFREKREHLIWKYGVALRGAMDTSDIYVIDVDDETCQDLPVVKRLMETAPYYRSISKNLPKIFIRVEGDMIETKNIALIKNPIKGKGPRVELQKGQWSFYNYGQQVENADVGIPTLSVEDLRVWFPDMPGIHETTSVRQVSQYAEEHRTEEQRAIFRTVENEPRDYIIEPTVMNLTILVEMLDQRRADDRGNWISVGYALRFHLGDEEAWPIYEAFSRKSPKFNPVVDKRMFLSLRPSGTANIDTIRKMAFFDNPDEYLSSFPQDRLAFREQRIQDLGFKKNTSIDPGIISDVFSTMEEADMYRFCPLSGKGGQWYSMNEESNIWVAHGNQLDNQLRYFMGDVIKSRFPGVLESKDRKKLKELLHKTGQPSMSSGVQKYLQGHLEANNFTDMCDTNPNLLAFTDCVYDLELLNYRATEPCDYIMTTVGYPQPTDIPEIQDELKAFMYSLFEDEEKSNYLMKVLASSLFKGNVQQEFYILTGEGSNGKSLLMSLVNKALGRYTGDISYTSLTSRRKSENPFSDWVKTKGMKLVKSLEPDAKSMLQGNRIKSITGGDVMCEREIYGSNKEWKPYFIFFLIANEVPRLDHIDDAVKRRLKFIQFPFKFKVRNEVAEWDDAVHREKKADLGEKFDEDSRYGQQFLLMLLKTYEEELHGKDRKEVLSHIPADFEEKKTIYEFENNIIEEFVEEMYDIMKAVPETDPIAKFNRSNYGKRPEEYHKDYQMWVESKGLLVRNVDKLMTKDQFKQNLRSVRGIGDAYYRCDGVKVALREKDTLDTEERPRVFTNMRSYARGFHPGTQAQETTAHPSGVPL